MEELVKQKPEPASSREMGAYASMNFGFTLIGGLVTYYLTYFLTDIWQLHIGAVGVMIIVVRLFDGAIDPFIGHYMDSHTTKHGKYLGYLRYWPIPLCLMQILLFTQLPIGGSLALAWCTCIYLVWSFCYSMVEGANNVFLGVMTRVPEQRKTINTFRIAASVGSVVVVSYWVMPLTERWGMGLTAAVISAVGFAAMLPLGRVGRERNVPKRQAPALKHALKVVWRNPRLILLAVVIIVIQLKSALRSPMTLYYVEYYMERMDMYPLIAVTSIVCSLFSQPLILWASKRWDTMALMLMGMGLSGVALLLVGLAGRNVMLMMAALCLYGVVSAFPANLIYVLAADTADELAGNGGASYGGTVNAVLGFGTRVGTAVGGGLSALILSATGYVPQVQQSATALMGIKAGFVYLPVLCCMVLTAVLWLQGRRR